MASDSNEKLKTFYTHYKSINVSKEHLKCITDKLIQYINRKQKIMNLPKILLISKSTSTFIGAIR